MSDETKAVALAFMHSWGGGIAELRNGIAQYFTKITIWENVGLNRLVGQAQALAFIDDYHRSHGLEAIGVELIAAVADERRVMTERIDRLLRADGSIIHAVRIMGIFEIDDGRIVAQRDYFNPAPAAA